MALRMSYDLNPDHTLRTTGLSLAEQIAQFENTGPAEFDAEDSFIPGPTGGEGDVNQARSHYLELGTSRLRQAQDSVSDPKYAGAKTSRKQLPDNSGEDPPSDGPMTEDEDEEQSAGEQDRSVSPESGLSKAPESDRLEVDKSYKQAGLSILPQAEENQSANLVALRKTRDEDREKGKAVSGQLAVWDKLLDARIRLQKSAVATNQLPSREQLGEDEDYQESLVKMLTEAIHLTDELFELQETLLRVNEGISPPPRKRRKVEPGVSLSDFDVLFRVAAKDSASLEETFHPQLVQNLNKWSAKIQAVAPSILSSKNSFSKGNQLRSVVHLIDEALGDQGKLLTRTQEYRGRAVRLQMQTLDGADVAKDPTVFDDTDFYHQLLKDVLDSQGGGSDWMDVQRQKKAKKKVDTKASKGRKIRYEVHEKLQNFMPPIPLPGMWHTEQIDELFSSLLGKGLEGALDRLPEPTLDVPDGVEFRVFG